MSSLWEFVKRNRGKIVAGAVVVGGAYAFQRFVLNRDEQLTETNYDVTDKLQLQARRHYVFDTNQTACDSSIVELIPCLQKRIEVRFNVDSQTAILQQQGADLSADQRIAIWHNIKVLSVARVVAVAYTFSLLTASLKSQMSILALQICSTFSPPQTSWWSRYVPSSLLGIAGGDTEKANARRDIDATTQQVFLKCIQYFTTEGLVELLDRIEEISKAEVFELDLKKETDSTGLRNIFLKIKERLDKSENLNFSRFVIPKHANQGPGYSVGISHLEALLARFMEILESPKCSEVVSSLVDFYLHAAVSFVSRSSNRLPLPLARVIPLLSNAFQEVSSTVLDSPLQNSLCSTDLHSFAMHVFSLPPLPL